MTNGRVGAGRGAHLKPHDEHASGAIEHDEGREVDDGGGGEGGGRRRVHVRQQRLATRLPSNKVVTHPNHEAECELLGVQCFGAVLARGPVVVVSAQKCHKNALWEGGIARPQGL